MSVIKEFKEFALKGNVMDMAVGVIIGGAFGKIVTSVIDDLIMPLIGKIVGNVDFTNLYFPLSDKVTKAIEDHGGTLDLVAAKKEGAVFAYGSFLTVAINFMIMAFIIFMMVKAVNKMKKKEAAHPTPAATPADIVLLTEIRDLLKK